MAVNGMVRSEITAAGTKYRRTNRTPSLPCGFNGQPKSGTSRSLPDGAPGPGTAGVRAVAGPAPAHPRIGVASGRGGGVREVDSAVSLGGAQGPLGGAEVAGSVGDSVLDKGQDRDLSTR